MSHILILRFSSLGDVLMTLPVIDTAARQNPDVHFTLVSRPYVRPLVELLPSNVHMVEADLSGNHRGFSGLNLLCRRLMALHPTAVADMHDVLRSQWLRFRLNITGVEIAHIKKDRKARREFILAKVKQQQYPTFEKYADVLRKLGLRCDLDFHSLYPSEGADLAAVLPDFDLASRPERHWVAIAPFAAHKGKTYPLDMMEQVVAALSKRGDVRVLLFGAGVEERAVLEGWSATYEHVESLAGHLKGLHEELAVISHCKVMVSMDSANMHLASLAAVPVVSIWGATHPLGGFLGYGQSLDNAIHRTDLQCRPCSTYGQKPCSEGDYPCLLGISPETIVRKTESLL
ncbi:MAG: glycosyltransferase family 9 protein [Bacteroidaceae bacterium]|nr:glycosyltransferase family 9 protein [Bacteroidaceae bacterium]